MLISNDWFQRMLMEANADGSAGGGGDAGAAGADKGAAAAKPGDKGAAGAGDKDKYFTQDDVNRMLAEHKRGLKKELETLGGQLTERDQKLQELMESHEEVVNVLKELSASADDKGKKPLINMDGNRDLKDIIKDVARVVVSVGHSDLAKPIRDIALEIPVTIAEEIAELDPDLFIAV